MLSPFESSSRQETDRRLAKWKGCVVRGVEFSNMDDTGARRAAGSRRRRRKGGRREEGKGKRRAQGKERGGARIGDEGRREKELFAEVVGLARRGGSAAGSAGSAGSADLGQTLNPSAKTVRDLSRLWRYVGGASPD